MNDPTSPGTIVADHEPAPRIADHLFRHGGGFTDYGRPTFRAFCGQCAADGRGSHTAEEHDPEAWAARERLRDAAPDLLTALERNAAINAAMMAWLDEEDFDCTANVPDSGGKNECDHCAITGMVKEAGDALKDADAAIAKARGEVAP